MDTSKAAIGAVGKRTFRPTDSRGKTARFSIATMARRPDFPGKMTDSQIRMTKEFPGKNPKP
jgi:hypothetical protein